jgi:hypothetical protein
VIDANVALLRWVTGAADPDALWVDEERLLRDIGEHGIASRAACRLATDRPGWATPALVAAVADMASDARRRVRAQIALVAELAAGSRDRRDLVPIKGFGAYLLTGDDCAARPSVDVDLLAADPDAAMTVLRRAGFAADAKAPSAHELWNAVRDGWKVELHRHLPCWSYRSGWSAGDFDPRRHPGTWRQRGAIVRRGIAHADVAGETVPVATGGGRVFVPGAEMALVITCAHAFRDFLSLATLYNRGRPRVRLAAAAEMLSLARHPGFRPAAYLALAERLGAHDAVEWARELLERSTGSAPWPAATPSRRGAPDHVARYPRHLWNDFLAEIDQPLTDVYAAGLPLATVVEQVGFDEVSAGHEHGDGGRALVRGDGIDGLRFRFDRDDRTLRVRLAVKVRPAAEPVIERARLELGRQAVEWDLDLAARTAVTREVLTAGKVRGGAIALDADAFALPGHLASGHVRVDASGYTAELALPLDDPRPAVPLAIGVSRLSSRGEAIAGRYVPMMLRR